MSASSSGSSTALRSHEGSNHSVDVPSILTLTLPPSDFSARLAIAGKALNIWSLVALNLRRTTLWRPAAGALGVEAGTPPGATGCAGVPGAGAGTPGAVGAAPGVAATSGTATGTIKEAGLEVHLIFVQRPSDHHLVTADLELPIRTQCRLQAARVSERSFRDAARPEHVNDFGTRFI